MIEVIWGKCIWFFELCVKHREWVFSGIGVTTLGGIGGAIWALKKYFSKENDKVLDAQPDPAFPANARMGDAAAIAEMAREGMLKEQAHQRDIDGWIDEVESLEKTIEHLKRDFGDADKQAAAEALEKNDRKAAREHIKRGIARRQTKLATDLVDLGNIEFLDDTAAAREAYEKALGLDPECWDARLGLGRVHERLGENDAAEAEYKAVLTETNGNGNSRAIAYRWLGNIYRSRGDLENAEGYYRQSLELAQAMANEERQVAALGNLGLLHQTRGDLDKAEAFYRRALELNEALGRNGLMAIQYNNLGTIHQTRGDLDKAEAFYRKALELNEALGSQEGMAIQYGNLGLLHKKRGDLDKAEEFYRKSLELEKVLGRKEGMASDYGNLGLLHQTRGDLDKAEAFFRKALELNEALGRKEGMAKMYGNLGNLHNIRGDLNEAEVFYRKSLALFTEVCAKREMVLVNRLLDDFPETDS